MKGSDRGMHEFGRVGRNAAAPLTALVVGLSMASALSGACLAGTHSVDQHNAVYDDFRVEGTELIAQTFTVGMTGTLDQVDFMLQLTNADVPGTATAIIEAVDGSGNPVFPVGTALSTSTGPATIPSTPNTWVSFSMTPLAVTVGQKYAIVVSPGTFFQAYYTHTTDRYNAGKGYEGAASIGNINEDVNADWTFRTYVAGTTTATAPPTSTVSSGSQSDPNGLDPMAGLVVALCAGACVATYLRVSNRFADDTTKRG